MCEVQVCEVEVCEASSTVRPPGKLGFKADAPIYVYVYCLCTTTVLFWYCLCIITVLLWYCYGQIPCKYGTVTVLL